VFKTNYLILAFLLASVKSPKDAPAIQVRT